MNVQQLAFSRQELAPYMSEKTLFFHYDKQLLTILLDLSYLSLFASFNHFCKEPFLTFSIFRF